MRFSTIIWYLRNRGIVEGNGFDENNHKKWRLTEKGKKLAESLVDMKNLMETS
jgi:predicted transcriptional regulator